MNIYSRPIVEFSGLQLHRPAFEFSGLAGKKIRSSTLGTYLIGPNLNRESFHESFSCQNRYKSYDVKPQHYQIAYRESRSY